LSTPILRAQSARAREFAWVRLCKARRLVRLPVRAVHVITSPSRAPWRIPSPNPPLKLNLTARSSHGRAYSLEDQRSWERQNIQP
jgi:hypothetical protein